MQSVAIDAYWVASAGPARPNEPVEITTVENIGFVAFAVDVLHDGLRAGDSAVICIDESSAASVVAQLTADHVGQVVVLLVAARAQPPALTCRSVVADCPPFARRRATHQQSPSFRIASALDQFD